MYTQFITSSINHNASIDSDADTHTYANAPTISGTYTDTHADAGAMSEAVDAGNHHTICTLVKELCSSIGEYS